MENITMAPKTTTPSETEYVINWSCSYCGRSGEVRFQAPIPGPAERYQACIEDHDIPICSRLPYVSVRALKGGSYNRRDDAD